MAYLSAGRGVMIHRQNCGNLAEYRKQPDKWLSVAWEGTEGRLFSSEIQLEINNRVGVLAAVASAIAGTETNIDQVSLEERDGEQLLAPLPAPGARPQASGARHPHHQAHAGRAARFPHAWRNAIRNIMSKSKSSPRPAAPAAIGVYSQAVRVGNTIWVSGQIPLDPQDQGAGRRRHRGAGAPGVRKLEGHREGRGGDSTMWSRPRCSLIDLSHFALVNKIMAEYFREPYPARAAVGVASLPRGAQVEVECIVAL
jgi:reactive intermediate/imine deaminase